MHYKFRNDPLHYNALVLKAACHERIQEDDLASDLFFKAISTEPNSVLGWQGYMHLGMKNVDRHYRTLIHVCVVLLELYSHGEKKKQCEKHLVELVVRYRVQVPLDPVKFQAICKSLLDREPDNLYAIEALVRMEIEAFLLHGFPHIIESTLSDAIVGDHVLNSCCAPLLTDEFQHWLHVLASKLASGEETENILCTTAIQLGRLAQLAVETLSQSGSSDLGGDFVGDSKETWKSIMHQSNLISLNNCVGLDKWTRWGYMELHACCFYILAAYKICAFKECVYAVELLRNFCRKQAECSDQSLVSTSDPQSFVLDKPIESSINVPPCTPFRSPIKNWCIPLSTKSYFHVIAEWALAFRFATLAALEELSLCESVVAEYSSSWSLIFKQSFAFSDVLQTLWSECCLVVNRSDLAFCALELVSAGTDLRTLLLDEQNLVLLLTWINKRSIRFRLCAYWALLQLHTNTDAQSGDVNVKVVRPILEELHDISNSISHHCSARDHYLLAHLLQYIITFYGSELVETDHLSRSVHYDLGIQANPKYFINHLHLGHLYLQKSDAKSALEALTRAHALKPNSVECTYHLALTLCQLDQYQKALDTYALMDQKDFSKEMWLNYGLIALKLNYTFKSVPALQKAVIMDPKNALYWEILGEAYLKRKSYETAIKTMNKAVQLDPHRPVALIVAGQAYRCLNQFELANEKFRLGLKVAKADASSSSAVSGVYVLALKELTELNLLWATDHFRDGLSGRALDELTIALDFLNTLLEYFLSIGPVPLWIYHFLGFAFSLPSVIQDPHLRLSVPGRIASILPHVFDSSTSTDQSKAHVEVECINATALDCLNLASVFFACALKQSILTKPVTGSANSNYISPDSPPWLDHQCLLINLGLHSSIHVKYLLRSNESNDEKCLAELNKLCRITESCLKSSISTLEDLAAVDQHNLDAQEPQEDVAEIRKVAQLELTEEQIIRSHLLINGRLRAIAWYGLAALYAVTNVGDGSEVDYCLCKSLSADLKLTEAGIGIVNRLSHQGRTELSSLLLNRMKSSDPENPLVWLASAQLTSVIAQHLPTDVVVPCSVSRVNHVVLKDLLQSASLGTSVCVASQLVLQLFPLLNEVVYMLSKDRSHLSNLRSYLRLAIDVTAEALNRATAFDPHNFHLWHNRGLLLQLAGLSFPAKHCLQKSLNLFKNRYADSTEGTATDKQLLFSQYFLITVICNCPDWSVADQILDPTSLDNSTFNPILSTSVSEAFAKTVILAHHPNQQPARLELAKTCLKDELHRLALQKQPVAVTSAKLCPHLVNWFDLSRRLQAPVWDHNLPRPLQISTLVRLPHFVSSFVSELVSNSNSLNQPDNLQTKLFHTIASVSHSTLSAYQFNTSEFADAGSSSNHLLCGYGRLSDEQLARWMLNNAYLVFLLSGDSQWSLSRLSQCVALSPAIPDFWASLAYWLLVSITDSRILIGISIKTGTTKPGSNHRLWITALHCVRIAVQSYLETPSSLLLADVLLQSARYISTCTRLNAEHQLISEDDTKFVVKHLRRAAALFPNHSSLSAQLNMMI